MSPRVSPRASDIANAISGATIHIVRGAGSILRLQQVLADFSAQCGQLGVMDDLSYFLSKPGTLRRVPHLLLFSKASVLNLERVNASDLVGAVLLYKYTLLGKSIGTFSTNDRSGRGTLVAPEALRSTIAERVSRSLLDRGALTVLISFRAGSTDSEDKELEEDEEEDRKSSLAAANGSNRPAANDKAARWAWRERQTPDYLPLAETFDATLKTIGQRTRRNMRYYRKRAEAELGCTFVPEIKIDRREFLGFNRDCKYAVPAKVAMWRYESLKNIDTPLFMGIRDRDGRWLSVLGGRRHHGGTEILWQMNRDDLSAYSLSLVMRSYFIEHEISQGMTKLYMEGGSNHPLQYSFVNDKVTDLVAMRRSWSALLVRTVAKRLIKPDNELALMLLDKSLYQGSS